MDLLLLSTNSGLPRSRVRFCQPESASAIAARQSALKSQTINPAPPVAEADSWLLAHSLPPAGIKGSSPRLVKLAPAYTIVSANLKIVPASTLRPARQASRATAGEPRPVSSLAKFAWASCNVFGSGLLKEPYKLAKLEA